MRVLFFMFVLSAFVWSSIGNVAALKGDANILRQGKSLKVRSGIALEVQDKIVTSSQTRVQVILKDDTVVTIGPNSIFIFDLYTFGTKANSHVSMRIDRGFFRSVTGKIGKLAPQRFKVKTAAATIGIRGTDFSALVSDNQEIITCYRGKITALIDNISHNIDAGMELDNSGGVISKRALNKKNKASVLNNNGIQAVDMADAIQQEIQKQIETPMTQPTIEFPN